MKCPAVEGESNGPWWLIISMDSSLDWVLGHGEDLQVLLAGLPSNRRFLVRLPVRAPLENRHDTITVRLAGARMYEVF